LNPIFIISLIWIIATGCATTQDIQLTQKDIQDLKNRLATTQQEVGALKGSLPGLQKGQAELDTKTDRIRSEIQKLQGKIDEIKFHAEKTSSETIAIREELVAKLKEQEEKIVVLRKDIDALKPPAPPPHPVIAQPQPGATPPSSLEGESAEELYNAAYSKLKSGDLEGARTGFKKFIEVYPRNELADNAQFWIGESYYREKKYEEAIVEFEDVVKKYPKENKVPDALLKEGLALSELDKGKEARYILKKLVEKYPKSEQAKTAKSKLEQM
jgi:tol-pal system protein YbgF